MPESGSSGEEWQPHGPEDDDVNNNVSGSEEEAGDTDAENDEADAEELEEDLMGARLDPFKLLEHMAAHETGQEQQDGIQPYEILANQARQARQKAEAKSKGRQKRPAFSESSEDELMPKPKGKKARRAFGATVEEIWDEDLSAQMGFGDAKARKRRKAKLRRRRRAQNAGKKTRDLPEEVTKALGEANLSYATGKYEEAVPLLEEVIKLAPSLSDPYHTLGLVYEAIGNRRKALSFLMIAAHLTPKDTTLWKRLAKLSAEMNFTRQAIMCLSKVIARDPKDVDTRWDRAIMFAEIEEYKKAVADFERIQDFRQGDGEVPLMLARLYHHLQQPDKACEALEEHVLKFPLSIAATHINILAELYMESKDYQKAADLIQKNMHLVTTESEPLIDLQTKLSICYIHMGELEQAKHGLDLLEKEAGPEVHDLCLDAADTLLEKDLPEKALKLYTIVNEAENGNTSLWNKMLECFRKLRAFDEGVQMFSEILTEDKLDVDTRREATIALAEMLAKSGQKEDSFQALEALDELGTIPFETLTRKAKVLLELDAAEEYLSVVLPVIQEGLQQAGPGKIQSSKGLDAKSKQRKAIIARKKKNAANDGIFKGYVSQDRRKQQRKEEDDRLALMLDSSSEGEMEEEGGINEGEGTHYDGRSETQFQTLLETSEVLIKCGKSMEAFDLLRDSLFRFSKRWQSRNKRDKVRIQCAIAALNAGEPAQALEQIRHTLSTWHNVNMPWNIFSKAATAQGSLRNVQKLLFVMSQSFPKCLPLRLTIGHYHSMNGHFGSALEDYLAAYCLDGTNEITLLCIGITYLNQSLSRKVPNRDKAVLAAFSFLQNYAKVRTNKQEAFYNLGRAAHQLNLVHLAVTWYQQALSAKTPESYLTVGNGPKSTNRDLTCAIAFNLSQIYRASGADIMARNLMRQYLTI